MPHISVDGTPQNVIIRHMGRERTQADVSFSHEQIKPTPSLQIADHGSFADRKVSDHRLNPAGTPQKGSILALNKALVSGEGLGLGRINRIATAPLCASFDPSLILLHGNPPEGAVRPFVKTGHMWKVWNEVNTKANQIRANRLIPNKSLFLSRTEGSNPSLSEYLYFNGLRKQVQSEVTLSLITSEHETP